jgi:hypothetical protein
MKLLRLPSPFSIPTVSLGLDTTPDTTLFLTLAMVAVHTTQARNIWVRVFRNPLDSGGGVRLSRVSMHPLSAFELLQDPDQTLNNSPITLSKVLLKLG